MLYRIINHRESLRRSTAQLRRVTDGLQRHLSSHDLAARDPALMRAADAIADANRTISRPALSVRALKRLGADVRRVP